MASAPQIALRDGSGFTTSLTFTTNEEAITITGVVAVNTAVIQVSINGGPFVSDPSLVSFVLQTFTIPNPAAFPTGLLLELGVNTIQIRTVDIVGAVSPSSTVTVTRVPVVTTVPAQIPTGIRLRRHRNSVDLLAAVPTDTSNFTGFNFYASTAAGGSTGYFKINATPVSASTEFEQDTLGTIPDAVSWVNTFFKNVRIRISEEDEFGNELAVRLDTIHDVSTLTGSLQFSDTLSNYTLNNFVVFNHNRSGGTNIINSDQFASVSLTDPLFYVVTGVYFDAIQNIEVETPFSQEVLGKPLIIDTSIKDLPPRTQPQIVADYVLAVQRVNSQISLIPGSVSRDVDIDPFASEAERIWFLLDFVHRSQSFLTLLPIDNVSGNGVSDSVAGSAYKQALKAALGLTSDTTVQALIDQQFDKLAGNVQKTRLPGRPSVGQVVLFTPTKPTQDITVPAGSFVSSDADPTTGVPSQRFRIGGSFVLPAANADAFFNFNTKRYEITADVVAEVAGSAANLPAGAIKNI